jgi:SdpC family antimicrobial peptide
MQNMLQKLLRVRSWGRPPRIVTAVLVGTAMVATVTLIALPGQQASAAPSSGEERFDGGQLLAGLLFGLGPVGKRYPELAMTRVEETASTTKSAEMLVAAIGRQDSGILDEFATAMYSGDHVRISGAVADLGTHMKALAPETGAVPNSVPIDYLTDSSLDVSRSIDLSTLQTTDLSLYFYQNTAVAVQAIVAAYVAYALNLAVALTLVIFAGAQPGEPAEQLTFERWVDRVATTLETD